MGNRFIHWHSTSKERPRTFGELAAVVRRNRQFNECITLDYGDFGLTNVVEVIDQAIRQNQRIALYADYDVDGTMSCVSWIWYFKAIGFKNFVHYIPCRFKEGYGLNLAAIKHLIDDERADVVVTMDTGITANEEAAYCRQRGVTFICTDHHVIQPEKMPDCIILNPKMHPDKNYQELCGCGITFVLLRRLAELHPVGRAVWTDLLALVGMATICDVVPLNGVNHQLAKKGVAALTESGRPILRRLMEAAAIDAGADEKDVGFRLGPRINAVGRLEHADLVVQAFLEEDPEALIDFMEVCNEKRKAIQRSIVEEASQAAEAYLDAPILFLGGDWHPGVVGIAASKLAEQFWRPVWLFQRGERLCKGSARSIPGFDVTAAMDASQDLFLKFGGHAAAGGYTFDPSREDELRAALSTYTTEVKKSFPERWQSQIGFDCELNTDLAELGLVDALDDLKPFGHGFEEPKFKLSTTILSTRFYNCKQTGEPRHTALFIAGLKGAPIKVMFFGQAYTELEKPGPVELIVSATRNTYRGVTSLSLMGHDFHRHS